MEKNRIIENDEALRIALEREKAGKYLLNQLISFNQIIDADFKKSSIYSRLGHLIREFGKFIDGETDVKMRVHLLLQFFYGEKGFFCDRETYFHASNLMLPHVFATKEGTPAVLGSILLFIAANFHLPIRGVNFPTQFLLRVDVDDEVAFIDPWNGKYVSQETIQTWLEGYLGFGTPLSEEYVGVGDLIDLEDRMYQVLKSALIREGRNEQALALIEHRLSETPDDPYEIRDRGVVYGNMECFHLAVPDLTYFVEQCPQDPVAPLIRLQLQDLKHIPYSFQ